MQQFVADAQGRIMRMFTEPAFSAPTVATEIGYCQWLALGRRGGRAKC